MIYITIILFIPAYYIARKMLYSKKFSLKMVLDSEKLRERWGITASNPLDFGIDYEDVQFHSKRKGSPLLKGWWIKKDSSKCIILVHGRWSNRLRPLRMLEFLKELPYSILLFDLCAHGDSEGKKFTMGCHEQEDLSAAVEFVKSKIPLKELFLYGFSAGTLTTALFAASHQNLVRKLILDSAFYSAKKVILDVAAKRKYPKFFVLLGFKLYEKLGNLKLSELDITKKADMLKEIPTLILHSKEDEMVHYLNSKVLAEALGDKSSLVIFDKGSHVNIYPFNKKEYSEKVLEFLNK